MDAKPAIAATTPSGLNVALTYDGTANPPVNANSYTVVGTVNDANYTGQSTGKLVISKASATVTLGSLLHVYDGTPKPAIAATTPSGLNVALTYDGSANPPVNANSYTVVGTVNDANYTGQAREADHWQGGGDSNARQPVARV